MVQSQAILDISGYTFFVNNFKEMKPNQSAFPPYPQVALNRFAADTEQHESDSEEWALHVAMTFLPTIKLFQLSQMRNIYGYVAKATLIERGVLN